MNIGWIDFSSEDREKVLAVISSLQEEGAVDEIGIGQARDAFADYFFPGTSTVQTIAKYFLIVPYIFKEVIENTKNKNINDILKEIDEKERECGSYLKKKCPTADGIIGKRVLPEKWVSRKPSNIYWNGIRKYGIVKSSSISKMISESLELRTYKRDAELGNKGLKELETDRDDEDVGRKESLYSLISVPDDYYNPKWKDSLSVQLTPTEARFLREKIQGSVKQSLLGYLLLHNVQFKKKETFESLFERIKQDLPEELKTVMQLAVDFNRLVYTARVRYNYYLSEGKNEEAVKEWQNIENNINYMTSVDIDKVFEKLEIKDKDKDNMYSFLDEFKKDLRNRSFDAADELLVKREISIKDKERAKLLNRDKYPNDEWVGGRYLDYRFENAERIIKDIYQGEKLSNVQDK